MFFNFQNQFDNVEVIGFSLQEWKQGKRAAESDKLVGASFFMTVDRPQERLELVPVWVKKEMMLVMFWLVKTYFLLYQWTHIYFNFHFQLVYCQNTFYLL